MIYPPMSYFPAPVLIPPTEAKRRKTEYKKDDSKKTRTNQVFLQQQVNKEKIGNYAQAESSTLCDDTKCKNETDTEWTLSSNCAKPTKHNVEGNNNIMHKNMYEILCDDAQEIEHEDVETVFSEASPVNEYPKDNERCDNKSFVIMHDLFSSKQIHINHVSDEDDSSVGHHTPNTGSNNIAVKKDDIPAFDPHGIVKESIQELLDNWQSGSKKDRTKAITRISYIARLT